MSGGPSSDAVVVISGGRLPTRPSPSSAPPQPTLVPAPSPSHSTPKRRKLLAPRRRGGSGGDLRACWGGGGDGSSNGGGGEGTKMPATAAADVAISAPIAAAVAGHHRHHQYSSHHHLPPHHSVRHHHITARALADITPRFIGGGSGGNADVDSHRSTGGVTGVGGSGGSIRITHLVGGVASGPGAGAVGGGAIGTGHGVTSAGAATAGSGTPRFPKLDECAHFHYENVELGPVQVSLCEEELKPLNDSDGSGISSENRSWVVQVTSLGRSWLLRRSYDNFRMLDSQLHQCVYDRKFSALPELPPEANVPTANPDQPAEEAVRCLLTEYLSRLTCLAGGGSGGGNSSINGSASLINCGPVLNWLELDNRGHRLLVTDDSDINTPAVAAAYAVRRYAAQAPDEISFEVGDMISVIDMPPPEESVWWRGKRGFEVGFFPCECVALIGEKVPRSLLHQLVPAAASQQQHSLSTISAPSAAGATAGPSSPAGTAPAVATPASSCASTASSSPSPASSAIVVASPSSQPGLPLPSKPVLRKHGKLIAFFRSFILSRPSRRRLKQSGILKERVFGCDLGEHLLNSGHEIPMVLKCCAEFIEVKGIVDGIYRLSGVTSNIQKLRNAFDEDRVPDLYEDEAILQDIHSVASLLKMYFRELPNPLCTYHLYHRFVSAVQAPHESRLSLMREVVKSLPPPHYRTLEYLMRHLARVAQRGGETGMTPRNVAIVWAPNLLRCKELEVGGVAALQGVGVQAVVTEFLVCYADLIFGGMDKGGNMMGQRLRQQRSLHHRLSPDQHKLPPGVSPGLVAAFAAENATPKRSRPKSLAISTPTKLLSLEEARTRALLAATGKADQEYIEVGGGPANLPAKYHTVIDMPARKRGTGSLKSKRSPGLGWKSFFSKKIPSQQQRQQSTSSLNSKRNILGGGISSSCASNAPTSTQVRGMTTPTDIATQEKAMTESDMQQSKRRLRPVKSAESLSSAVASAGSSTRNSAALDLEIGCLGSIEGVLDQITGQSSGVMGDDRRASSPSVTGKPSHSRSVSHDSYFDHLAEPLLLLTEEDDIEREEEGESGNAEEEEGLLDLSEIQLDFELEEREMRIFSEDETLVSTTPLGSGGSLSRSPLLPHPTRRRLIGSPQGCGPRARPEDTGSSADPSPKKKKSGASVTSPGARKRTKVDERRTCSFTKSPASSSPSPTLSPIRSSLPPLSMRPSPSRSIPSMMTTTTQRSTFGEDAEDEEEELRYIDSQSPEPPPLSSVNSIHRESPASYGSRQSSRGSWPSQNHYHQAYQQQQMVLVHAEVHPSPSEDASSVSRADATVSDNESFTVHGGETSSEGDLPIEVVSITEPLPEDEEEEEEEEEDGEGGVSYSPLVNDATAETTPVDLLTPAYENVPWVRAKPENAIGPRLNAISSSEKKKIPTAAPRNLDAAAVGRVYQNIHSSFNENLVGNSDEAVYEEVQVIKRSSGDSDTSVTKEEKKSGESENSIKLRKNQIPNGTESDPEEVYQQVKAFRKSVQEVNEMLGGTVVERSEMPKTNKSEQCVNNVCEVKSCDESSMLLQSEDDSTKCRLREGGIPSYSPLASNASSGESSGDNSRAPSEEMALLRTPSGRSGNMCLSGGNRRASLPISPTSSNQEDSHRRRFDSEIGRDILRERRVKMELERVRGEPGSGVSSPVSSEGTGTRLTPSPITTPIHTMTSASSQSPIPMQSPAQVHSTRSPVLTDISPFTIHSPLQSPVSTHPLLPINPLFSQSPVPPQSPIPAQSPIPTQSPIPLQSPIPSQSPIPAQSPVPAQSPIPAQSPVPTQSPIPTHSPIPAQSPVPVHSPLLAQSPIPTQSSIPGQSPIPAPSPIPSQSPLPPHSPISVHSPISKHSPFPAQSPAQAQPCSPSQSPILVQYVARATSPPQTPSPSRTPSRTSPSRTVSSLSGASGGPRSPNRTIPSDLPSGFNLSISSAGRTSPKKLDENPHSEDEGKSISDAAKVAQPGKDLPAKNGANETFWAFSSSESSCRSMEGGSLRGLPGRSWSVSDSRRLAVRKASVRELLSRFEGKEGSGERGDEEEDGGCSGGRRASAPSHRRPTPPCLRARANRASHASALSVSLDEERFLASAREAIRSPSQNSELSGSMDGSNPKVGEPSGGQLIRVRTSPDINTDPNSGEDKIGIMAQNLDSKDSRNNKESRGDENDETEDAYNVAQARLETSLGALQMFPDSDDPERRERIERYKRERRSFLREKYRSESFRGERDEVLKRLKQKVASVPQEEQDSGTAEGESRSRRRSRRSGTDGDGTDGESQYSPTLGKLSSRSRRRATSSESDEAGGDGFSRVGVSPVLSRSPNRSLGGMVPTSPTSSLGTPSPGCIRDVAALFETRDQKEKGENK